jgi:Skp family chaperone for outer membrane proteins
MKSITTALLLLMICVSSGLKAQSEPSKHSIALISSYHFSDPQQGITKYLAAQQAVTNEFKAKQDELKNLQSRVEVLQQQARSNSSSADSQKKLEEAERLNRDLRSKSEMYQSQYNKRYDELVTPLQTKSVSAIKQWALQKGLTAVVDVYKDDKGMMMFINEDAVRATSLELIRYLNSVL